MERLQTQVVAIFQLSQVMCCIEITTKSDRPESARSKEHNGHLPRQLDAISQKRGRNSFFGTDFPEAEKFAVTSRLNGCLEGLPP